MPIEIDHLEAYFNAAIAVAALEVDLPVRRLSIELNCVRRGRPKLMQLNDYVRRRSRGYSFERCVQEYVTVLLAGTVGRVIGLNEYLSNPELHPEISGMRRAYRQDALLCREPETDKAYAIIFASLDAHDHDESLAIFRQLWDQADKMLSSDLNRSRIERLVGALKRAQVLAGEEIILAMNDLTH